MNTTTTDRELLNGLPPNLVANNWPHRKQERRHKRGSQVEFESGSSGRNRWQDLERLSRIKMSYASCGCPTRRQLANEATNKMRTKNERPTRLLLHDYYYMTERISNNNNNKTFTQQNGRRRRTKTTSDKMLPHTLSFRRLRQTTWLLLFLCIAFKSSPISDNIIRIVEAQVSLTGNLQFYNQQHSPLTSSSSAAPLLSSNISKRDLSAKQLEPPGGSTKVCQVNGGESVAIVEIEESRGSDMSQSTNPAELPITGSVIGGEIELKIESETHKYFHIQDKKLRLLRPLDRDAILMQNTTQIQQQPITSIYLQISCLDKRAAAAAASNQDNNNKSKQPRKVIIPVLVKVLDLNDNAPKFSSPTFTVQVDELAPIGTIVMDSIQAIDLDSAQNGLIEYSLVDNSLSTPGGRLVQRAQPYGTGASQTTNLNYLESSSGAPSTTVSAPPLTTTSGTMIITTTTASSTTTTTTAKPSDPPNESSSKSDSEQPQTSPEPGSNSPSSRASAAEAAVSRSPTINLNSEPIVNGPMDDGDEIESDEALLASMNSTDIETESDTMVLMMHPAGSKRRARRRRRRYAPSNNPSLFGLRRFVGSSPGADGPLPAPGTSQESSGMVIQSNRPKDLWTNLMTIGDEQTLPAAAASQQPLIKTIQPPQVNSDQLPASSAPSPSSSSASQQEWPRASIEYFNLELTPQTNRPILRLKHQLDYESKRTHVLTLVATDRTSNKLDRLTSSATLIIKVLDGDDQGPAFVLEQGGCATGSVPPPTTMSLTAMTNNNEDQPQVQATSRAPTSGTGLLQRRQLEFADDQEDSLRLINTNSNNNNNKQNHNLPKGFKVTDENFDFSDASPDSGLDESDSDEQDDQPAGSIMRLDPSVPIPSPPPPPASGQRPRRFPTQVGPAIGPAVAAEVLNTPTRFLKPLTTTTTVYHHQQHHHYHHQTSGEHYHSYSCLSASPVLNTGGQAEYFATVMSGESDYLLRIAPQAIKARDRDELNAPIRYSFINGTPTNYSLYFQINPHDASIKQVAPIERSQMGRVVLWVQAQEQTAKGLSSVAKLTINVIPSDKNPPVLIPNSYAGFVDENSPIGTSVTIEGGGPGNRSSIPLRITVIDADYSPSSGAAVSDTQQTTQTIAAAARSSPQAQVDGRSAHLYEFETTSDAFKVNKDGVVYVNRWPLDRDAPPGHQSVHMFQVTARQIGLASSRSISSPVSINISLLDLNDNPPTIANSSLVPIQLPASSGKGAPARLIATIRSVDPDEPQNARARFSIHHVSNKGSGRFRISEDSGQLEALGKFQTGEQFSLTLQVQDELGRSSQGILEVTVVPGPNSGGPQFLATPETEEDSLSSSSGNRGPSRPLALHHQQQQLAGGSSYSVVVNEGVAPNSAIFQLQAIDPENDPITYSILQGNINNDFYINSKTGTIFVANKLDREEVSAYTLLVQARDSGGLATKRALHIGVSDNNDQNPVFSAPQYTFSVEEGVQSSRVLGRVWASDSDAGDNGRVQYHLEPSPATDTGASPFSIGRDSGEIKLEGPLDYEQAKSHTLLVTAKDQGEEPRSATVSVLIRVIDVQDEAPYFERYHLESRLQENLPAGHRVAQVQARDPDSVAQITYILRSGDSSLFAVDPQTGLITTRRGLDFEEAKVHTIIVGTSESGEPDLNKTLASLEAALSSSSPLDRSPVCRIEITVLDTNDHVPQFVGSPLPVRVQDTAQLGSQVAKLTAQDLDGSEPNNQIRYELVMDADSAVDQNHHHPHQHQRKQDYQYTSTRCAQSFMIDASTGSVSIKSDLRRDSQSECQLVVRAKDLGIQPQSLSSDINLIVYIDHIAEISSASMIGFADTMFTIELEENCAPNTLVKVLPIVNKPKVIFPMSCEIVSGNELAKFYVMDNEQRDCELRTRDPVLDYEQKQRFMLTIRLNTIGSGSPKTMAQVQVNLLDVNDNKPIFQQPARYSHLTQNKFLAGIACDAPSETQVLQLRASDADSPHSNGLISYELLNEHELEGRFKVDPIDGIVRTSRPVEDVVSSRLPMRLKVMARDNPEQPSSSLSSVAELVVNLIDDRHRIALVLEDSPTGRVLDSKEELLSSLQERTGLISGLEKAESLKLQRNGTLEADVSGTDFWFYLIEPGLLRIVPNDDPRVRNALFESRSQSSLLDIIGQIGFQKARVRLPYEVSGLVGGRSASESPSRSPNTSANNLASGLILLALFIAITSAIVIVYQCGSWSSYSRANKEKLYLQQQQQQHHHHQQQQQQSYYQCNSFLGGYPKSPGSLNGSPHESYPFRSAFSTLVQQQQQPSLLGGCQSRVPTKQPISKQQQQQSGGGGGSGLEPIYQLEPQQQQTNAINNKEYETQMLKMSVIFDDCNSINEQNSHENNISKNLNI